MLRIGLATFLLALLVFGGGLLLWLASDRGVGALPPASMVQAAALRGSRSLPAFALPLLQALPVAQARPVEGFDLPPWEAPPRTALTATHRVDSLPALTQALREATAGAVIELAAGRYELRATLVPAHPGRAEAPITVRGAPGARLVSHAVEAIKIIQPYWTVEHLAIEGVCAPEDRCEHALHIAGNAHHVRLHGLALRNFNAAVKVNGEGGRWPDHGILSHSWLVNDRPRPGSAPATPFDLVGASYWQVTHNRVEGVAKAGGDGIAYGIFMKGGGEEGVIDHNWVVCTPHAAFAGVGAQVGISFGGGTTDPATLRHRHLGFEHLRGQARQNIVLNCNDTALDVNQSAGIRLERNSLLGGGGIVVRGQGASAEALHNLSSGAWHARAGNELEGQGNRRVGVTADTALTQLRAHAEQGLGAGWWPGSAPTSP